MDLSEWRSATARHPWEIARARFFLRVLASHVPLDRPMTCMDVGCGDAWFLGSLYAKLPPGSTAYGLDAGFDAATIAAIAASVPPGVTLVREEPQRTFDLLCLMDVCEHVEDDRAFLSGLVGRRLRSEGWVLFSVPAWPALFSTHDTALRHFRRYTPTSAKALLDAAGLDIVTSGGLFHSLVVPRAAQVAWERVTNAEASAGATDAIGLGTWNAPALITEGVTMALGADQIVSRFAAALKIEVPGLSWWALCRRRA